MNRSAAIFLLKMWCLFSTPLIFYAFLFLSPQPRTSAAAWPHHAAHLVWQTFFKRQPLTLSFAIICPSEWTYYIFLWPLQLLNSAHKCYLRISKYVFLEFVLKIHKTLFVTSPLNISLGCFVLFLSQCLCLFFEGSVWQLDTRQFAETHFYHWFEEYFCQNRIFSKNFWLQDYITAWSEGLYFSVKSASAATVW